MAQQFDIRKIEVYDNFLKGYEAVGRQNARLQAAKQAEERMALQAMGMDLRERAMELKTRQAAQDMILAEKKFELAQTLGEVRNAAQLVQIDRGLLTLKDEKKEVEDEAKLQAVLQVEDAQGMPLAARMTSQDKKVRDMARQEFSAVRAKIGLNMPGKRASREIYNLFRQADQLDQQWMKLNPPQKPKELSPADKKILITADQKVAEAESGLESAKKFRNPWWVGGGENKVKISQAEAKKAAAEAARKRANELVTPFVLNPRGTPDQEADLPVREPDFSDPGAFLNGPTLK